MNKRRNFLKVCSGAVLSSCVFPKNARAIESASSKNIKAINVDMEGCLDDDLHILKGSGMDWDFVDCQQMHNITGTFFLEGKKVEAVHIPGWIEYHKTIQLKENDYLLMTLANEREERQKDKALLIRSHYKSCPLSVDGEVLIPSMIPEENDLPNTPVWFDPKGDNKDYNYYRAWENAVVNIALVVPREGKYRISLANKQGVMVASKEFDITCEIENIRFEETYYGKLDDDPMTEIDGGVYNVKGKKRPDDYMVRQLCPTHILLEDNKGNLTRFPFPYPFPYPNRIFIKAA